MTGVEGEEKSRNSSRAAVSIYTDCLLGPLLGWQGNHLDIHNHVPAPEVPLSCGNEWDPCTPATLQARLAQASPANFWFYRRERIGPGLQGVVGTSRSFDRRALGAPAFCDRTANLKSGLVHPIRPPISDTDSSNDSSRGCDFLRGDDPALSSSLTPRSQRQPILATHAS